MAENADLGAFVSSPIPGPCYPNWPDMTRAFAVHRLDEASGKCRYCKQDWPRQGDGSSEVTV